MGDLRSTAAAATTTAALLVIGYPSASAATVRTVSSAGTHRVHVPAQGTLGHHGYEPVVGVDFGTLTDADVAMMQHAMSASAEEIDFSEFYLEDDE